jgi:hypothetical protein
MRWVEHVAHMGENKGAYILSCIAVTIHGFWIG